MNKYEIEETVYLITDPEKLPRLVTGYSVRKSGVTYALACGSNESWHWDFEITNDLEKLQKKNAVGLGK